MKEVKMSAFANWLHAQPKDILFTKSNTRNPLAVWLKSPSVSGNSYVPNGAQKDRLLLPHWAVRYMYEFVWGARRKQLIGKDEAIAVLESVAEKEAALP